MTLEIEIGGVTRTVSIERADGPHRYRILVDGTPHLVDAVQLGSGGWSLVDPEGGRSFDVAIAVNDAGRGLVRVGADQVAVVVNGRRTRRGRAEIAGPAGDVRVVAPMPGKVVRVLVKPGDQVEPRQPLVVVEAMKMENELSAGRGGVVKEVAAGEGASVEAGRLLVVVG